MVRTTLEMDGFFTEEDIKNKDTVVFQCFDDFKWTIHTNWGINEKHIHVPCVSCGKIHYDPESIRSLRTYVPEREAKRRPNVKKKKR